MKRLLILIMAVVMTLGLASCGGQETAAPAPTSQESTGQNEAKAPTDKAEDQQALKDADYAQIIVFVGDMQEHDKAKQNLSDLRDQVKNGQAEESALLDATKQVADNSQALLKSVKDAQWKTDYYSKHVSLLIATIEALAQSEMLAYEAGAANDASKLESVTELITEYDTKLGEFLDLMGM